MRELGAISLPALSPKLTHAAAHRGCPWRQAQAPAPHPGLEMTYILEGEYTLMVDGRADQALRPGDWFEVPAEVPHSVTCHKPGRALAHYVVQKDKPLVSWL